MEHEVCLSLQDQDPGKDQRLMWGASATPFSELSRAGLQSRVPCAARSDPSARSWPALLSAGNPWARCGGGGGDGGGASRWEEAEAEGHASRLAPPRRAAQPETFSQTSGGGLAARSAGAAQREFGGLASRGGRVAHARAGLLVGTRSSCGSARAVAEKMPSLRPAALRALLWLWLCGAGPARGEYRAPGRLSLWL